MFRKLNALKKKEEGFTLIELMIVVAILGVLAAVAIPLFLNYIATSKRTATMSNYENAQRVVKGEYSRVDAGNTPAVCADLIAEMNGEQFVAGAFDGVPTNPNPYFPKDNLGVLNPGFVSGAAAGQDGLVAVDCANYTGIPGESIGILVRFIDEDGVTNQTESITLFKE